MFEQSNRPISNKNIFELKMFFRFKKFLNQKVLLESDFPYIKYEIQRKIPKRPGNPGHRKNSFEQKGFF